MLRRRNIAQEEAAGETEEGQGADEGIRECEHSAGGVYCGVEDGRGIRVGLSVFGVLGSYTVIENFQNISIKCAQSFNFQGS